jgi:hypothetical protein
MVSMLMAGTMAWAGEYGTAAEAKAMLTKAVAELKIDQKKALLKFTKKEAGFGDRDLYVYCGNAGDGMFSAHPKLMGTSLKFLKDSTGDAFGERIYQVAKDYDGSPFSKVSYMWPRPGETEQSLKSVYVTKVGDQICCVGIYEPK